MPDNAQLTVLFLGSRPHDEDALALKTEALKIGYRLSQLGQGGRVRIIEKWGVGFADLPGLLDDHQPDIVHFSGHGDEEGYLLFEDDRGMAHRVPHEAVIDQLSLSQERLHCVVLNACHTAGLAQQLAREIDFVIGSQEDIGDRAAIAFAETFYPMLARGKGVESAFKEARAQFRGHSVRGRIPPELYVRDGVDRQRVLMTPPVAAVANPPPPVAVATPALPMAVLPHPGKKYLFINHVDKDHLLCDELKTWLRAAGLPFWDISQIPAGSVREQIIQKQLTEATHVLLLLSAAAMADPDWARVTDEALARHSAGSARVVPIRARPVFLDSSPLAKHQILPPQGPVMGYQDRDVAWQEIIAAIKALTP